MDRYAVIIVDRKTGEPELYGIYEGEEGCEKAHERAVMESDGQTRATVVGLI